MDLEARVANLEDMMRRHIHDDTESHSLNAPASSRLNYFAKQRDNGSATGTATIDWSLGNVQYITLTGNTTLTFTNPQSDMRVILFVAGAFTPTFPGTVRWSGGTTPAATATSGHKDIYAFVYSGKENLYDGIQSPNFAIT